MSVTGSLTIRMNPTSFSKLIRILQSAGWEFGNQTISSDHYPDPFEMGHWQATDLSDAERLLESLDRLSSAGEYVAVVLYWQGNGVYIDCVLEPSGQARFHFDGTRPILACSQGLTDYSWLLSHIACPLEQAGCNLLAVSCQDDW